MLDRLVDAFATDAGDHRQLALDLVSDDARRFGALLGAQREDFAGMAVGDETADALVAGEPLGEAAQLGFVDV